jgi:hypothetical protein
MRYIERIECQLGMIVPRTNEYVYVMLALDGVGMVPVTCGDQPTDIETWLDTAWQKALRNLGLASVEIPLVRYRLSKRGLRWVQFEFSPAGEFAKRHGHSIQIHKTVLRRIAEQLEAVPKSRH